MTYIAKRAKLRGDSIRRKKLVREFVREQGGICVYCARRFTRKRRPTFEHIVPNSKGGMDVRSNGAASCFACNQERGAANHWAFLRFKQRERDAAYRAAEEGEE